MAAQLHNVTLHLDECVWRRIRTEAVRENTTIQSIVSEALMSYIKWIRKAELEDQEVMEEDRKKRELQEAMEELDRIRMERLKGKKRKGMKK